MGLALNHQEKMHTVWACVLCVSALKDLAERLNSKVRPGPAPNCWFACQCKEYRMINLLLVDDHTVVRQGFGFYSASSSIFGL
jgi:hypothetical protein